MDHSNWSKDICQGCNKVRTYADICKNRRFNQDCAKCRRRYCFDCADSDSVFPLIYHRCLGECYYCDNHTCYGWYEETIRKLCVHCATDELRELVDESERRFEQRRARTMLLTEVLARYQLIIRTDSKLCTKYINGDEDDLSMIVDKLCQVRYLYDYCEMENELQRVANTTVSRELIFSTAKNNIVKRIGVYPMNWPWIAYDYDDIKQRNEKINNEIIEYVYHPMRIHKWLDDGNDIDDYMM